MPLPTSSGRDAGTRTHERLALGMEKSLADGGGLGNKIKIRNRGLRYHRSLKIFITDYMSRSSHSESSSFICVCVTVMERIMRDITRIR